MRTIITAPLFGKKLSVPVSEITHFTSGDKYVTAHYPGGELIIDESLTSLVDEFAEKFARCHRRAVVAKDRIWKCFIYPQGHHGHLYLIGVSEPIPLSRTYAAQIRALLDSVRRAA